MHKYEDARGSTRTRPPVRDIAADEKRRESMLRKARERVIEKFGQGEKGEKNVSEEDVSSSYLSEGSLMKQV